MISPVSLSINNILSIKLCLIILRIPQSLSGQQGLFPLPFPPPRVQVVLDAQDVEDLAHDMVHEARDVPGPVVEARSRGEDNHPGLGQGQHVAEVDG